MTATELPADDWHRAVYGRSQISGTTRRRQPRPIDRERIIQQQGYVCLYCEIPVATRIRRMSREVMLLANWDHFIPYAYSQQNPSNNWVLACHVCNGIKTSRMFANVETARQAILPERIAKGYESPDTVFHRLGLQRQQGVSLLAVARPTDSQLEVLQVAARGLPLKEIALEMGRPYWAVQKKLLAATRRMGVDTRTEAIEIAIREGFISRPEPDPDRGRNVMADQELHDGRAPGPQAGAQGFEGLQSVRDRIARQHATATRAAAATHTTPAAGHVHDGMAAGLDIALRIVDHAIATAGLNPQEQP